MSDSLWPHGQKADPQKLVDAAEKLASECGDEKARASFAQTKREFEAAKTAAATAPQVVLRDLPEECLDGSLGEICDTHLKDFPRAYSWPALLAVASALIDRRAPGVRTNLYVGLVGPIHSGKSQAIDRAQKILGVESPVLLDIMSGSAEQLVRKVKDAAGNPRLFSPDELGHTLEKMRIEHSSFSFVLNSAYYRDRFEVLLGRRETATFDCVLSIVGGLVEDRFSELFHASTCGGLHDRFTFGLCPGNFQYDYWPFQGKREQCLPVCVHVDPEVWEAKTDWLKTFPDWNPRVIENAIRAATICAAYNRKQVLEHQDLGPHFRFARYQHNIRKILKPNPGETVEGRLAHKFLDYLSRHNGLFVQKRDMFRDTRGYDFGPSICERALAVLAANGDIATQKVGRRELVRLVTDAELDSELQS